MPTGTKLIPIYKSSGDVGAFLLYPHLYDPAGEWMGWVTPDRLVFSVNGHYVGVLTMDPRILRTRERDPGIARQIPPPPQVMIRPPAHLPLSPTMPEVPVNMIDVLDEAPELLPAIGFGDLVDDME
jgi:hypothetical protein